MNMHSKVLQFPTGFLVFNCVEAHAHIANLVRAQLGSPIAAGFIHPQHYIENQPPSAQCYGESTTLGIAFPEVLTVTLTEPSTLLVVSQTPCLWIGNPATVQPFEMQISVNLQLTWDLDGNPRKIEWNQSIRDFLARLPDQGVTVAPNQLRYILSPY